MIAPFIFICLFNDNDNASHCDIYNKGDNDDDGCYDYNFSGGGGGDAGS
jgi:hypothetical protein